MGLSSSAIVAENRYSYTEIRTERIVHDSTIKKFDLLPEAIGEKICSPSFYSWDKSEKWNLPFYPRGDHTSTSRSIDYGSLFLVRDSPEKSQIRVNVQIKISKSDIILRDLSTTYKYGPQESHGYRQFLERSKLLTINPSDDDRFTISCIIEVSTRIITLSFDEPICDSQKSQLSDDFRLLLEDPTFSDFTIIVGDRKFETHKVILARRSPVFAAMFKHKNLEENRKKEMKIENIEPDVIKGMLEFMYTGQVTNLEELASGLLEAADKYDLEKLRIMCEKTLHADLNKENAAEVLMLADLHRADTLKTCVMKYILDNASEVVKSNNWKKIRGNPELLLKVVDQLVLPEAANNAKCRCSKA